MYHALYRKYRPCDFDSVIGQDSIIKTLRNSIINHNFSHAYMFYGPRGTGKTSVSKIFARNVNCLNPIDGNSCCKCDACSVSFSKDCVDIIEIDAASNNGVDEIRDLKNRISLVPSELKFKVYIIDEVHMLSIGAFNALLKTLEEPPEHAIFILATTDPQKVPETIISRCQCFSFKRISEDSIFNRLKFVCSEEQIGIDDLVLKKIAFLSDGGMRDALGFLDKLVSYTGNQITMNDFYEINDIVSDDDIYKFLSSILNGNISLFLEMLKKFSDDGKNLVQIIYQLINIARNLIVNYYISDKSVDFSIVLLQNFVNTLNEKMFDIKRSDNVKIYIEILILKFINDYVNNNVDTFVSNNKKINIKNNNNIAAESKINIENSIDSENVIVSLSNDVSNDNLNDNAIPKIVNINDIMKIRVNNTFAFAEKKYLMDELKNFELLKDYSFDQEFGYIVCAILDGKLRAASKDNLIISYEYESNVDQNLLIIDKISDIYKNITNSDKKIAIISDKYWDIVKREYIENLKNNIKYVFIDEPEPIFEDLKNNDIINSNAINLFGDVVEIN